MRVYGDLAPALTNFVCSLVASLDVAMVTMEQTKVRQIVPPPAEAWRLVPSLDTSPVTRVTSVFDDPKRLRSVDCECKRASFH